MPSVIQDATISCDGSAPKVRCSPCTGDAPEPPGCGRYLDSGAASAIPVPSSGIAATAPAPPSRPRAERASRRLTCEWVRGVSSAMRRNVRAPGEHELDVTIRADGSLIEAPAPSGTCDKPPGFGAGGQRGPAQFELPGQRIVLVGRPIDG